MSCFDVKILDPDINTITIESCIGDQPASIEVITYNNTNILEVNSCVALLPSDINDLIPVKDILPGSGIGIVSTSGIYTISLNDPNLTSSDIIDFLESVQDIIGQSGLYAGNYINLSYNDTTGFTTISVTGLQPSGNYSVVGHTHISSNITDFNSSVSGLLPIKNITAGSGIGISSVSGDYIVSVTGTFGLTSEEVDDRVSKLLIADNYVNLNYDDIANSLTISVTGLQPSGNYSLAGHTHFSSDITDFSSSVSGLLPPSNFTSLIGVSGITVSNSGTNYTVSLTDPTIQLADITDLSSNSRTFLLTPSSSNLATLITDETGSGFLVFNNSPTLSGIPTAPTAPSGTNNTQIANTAFVRTEISNLINSAPSTLDTLNELASALGNDPNFATSVTNSLASKAALAGAIFTGPVTIPSGTGNFNSLTVNGIGISLSGHSHTIADIINFNSGVSGLLPNITGINYIISNFSDNIYSIGVTGLQPSGNYSVVGHTHSSLDITNFNSSVSGLLPTVTGIDQVTSKFTNNTYTISVTGLQPSGNYSVVGHAHITSDITNFSSGVSGLLPGVSGSGYAVSNFANNIYTISVTGLQPSGNYSAVGHNHTISDITNFSSGVKNIVSTTLVAGTGIVFDENLINNTFTISTTGLQPSGNYSIVGHVHTSSDITNFDNSVSGLLPVKNISAGSGIGVTSLSGDYTVSVTGTFGLTSEEVDDRISSLLIAGNYINLNYNDNLNSLTISTTGLQPSGNYSLVGHTHVSSEITNFNSSVSGLLPSITGSGYITSNFSNNIYNLSVTGLQPSGNYSLIGHNHSSSEITDFNTSVSGLLPVTNIIAGSNIGVSQSGTVFTIAVTGLTAEDVDDRVANLLIAGTGISLNYNDNANTLTVNTTTNIINSSNLYLWSSFR
jgi:hypothetical protein